MTANGNAWRWIEEDICLAAHQALLAEFGGPVGVRDTNALGSALARPRNLAAYGEPDISALAAAYAYGVMRNHPFVDGNKRTGFAIALVFLLDNGSEFIGTDVDAIVTMLAVAAGEMSDEALAARFRNRIRPPV
jgi:death-on-curing protein